MKKIQFGVSLTVLLLSLPSCIFQYKNERNLSKSDLVYLRKLGILKEDEKIELLESNGGFKRSGNFITDERIASYWIDGRNDEVNSAEYSRIDSIKTVDRIHAWTYSSYMEVYHSHGKMFQVYVDADSLRTWQFFNRGITNWKKIKK